MTDATPDVTFPLPPDLVPLAALGPGLRILGLDLGTKTIGLALSDVERRLATPLVTLERIKFGRDVEALRANVERFGVGALVVGLPVNMGGTEGPRAQATRAFVRNLLPRLPLPVALWDERLTTVAVTRALIEADASRARRRAVVDRMAAAYILQGVLDRLAIAAQATSGRDGREAGHEIVDLGM